MWKIRNWLIYKLLKRDIDVDKTPNLTGKRYQIKGETRYFDVFIGGQ